MCILRNFSYQYKPNFFKQEILHYFFALKVLSSYTLRKLIYFL